MTNQELDTLEQLAAAATPGPWVKWVAHADVYAATPELENEPHCLGGVRMRIAECDFDENFDFMGTEEELEEQGPYDGDANAEFIAAARAAVPALIEQVRQLQAELELAYKGAAEFADTLAKYQDAYGPLGS